MCVCFVSIYNDTLTTAKSRFYNERGRMFNTKYSRAFGTKLVNHKFYFISVYRKMNEKKNGKESSFLDRAKCGIYDEYK